jgi:hypothetical protein
MIGAKRSADDERQRGKAAVVLLERPILIHQAAGQQRGILVPIQVLQRAGDAAGPVRSVGIEEQQILAPGMARGAVIVLCKSDR